MVPLRPFRGRSLDTTREVQVFRNLTRKCYSVKQDGYTVGHVDAISLSDAEFVVNERGRRRVVRTGRKNVHAWVKGTVAHTPPVRPGLRARYNPKELSSFIDATAGIPLGSAQLVVLDEEGVWYSPRSNV